MSCHSIGTYIVYQNTLVALGQFPKARQDPVFHALHGAGHRVDAAGGLAAARQGHIDGFGGQLGFDGGGFQGLLASGDQLLQFLLHHVDLRAGRPAPRRSARGRRPG